jgi:thiamine transport system ATP-binding protein
MLTLENLHIVQGDFELRADLSVNTGELTAIIGPSGGGKSTLLGSISGHIPQHAGRVLWGGVDLGGQVPGARPVSIIFQDNNLFPHFDAFQNVAVGLRPSLRISPAETAQVHGALKRVGLAGMGDRKPADLSGGQQSRVALARALVRRQPLLLMDEPFAALGPALRAEMLDLVAQLARDLGATLLMVTHDPADAERIARQTIFVDNGVVEPPVPTAQLLANPPRALRDYLGQ